MLMKTVLSLSLLSFVVACDVPKDEDRERIVDTGDDTEEIDDTPVWENVRHGTSETFLGGYADGSNLYVVTTGGQTWQLTDGDWSNIPTNVDEEDLNGLWGAGAGATLNMVAVGNAGVICTWDGVRWETQQDETANFYAIDGPSVNDLVAVGGAGAWSNVSGTWEAQTSAGFKLNDVWYDGTTGVAVGEDGLIGTYVDGEWTFDETDEGLTLYGVSGTNSSDIWAVGKDGTVIHYNGTEWETIDIGTLANLWSVWSPAANVAYVVGANGEAYMIRGNLVSRLYTGVDNILYKVTGTNEANVYAIGSRGVALHYTGE
jgi:hypothetical protein